MLESRRKHDQELEFNALARKRNKTVEEVKRDLEQESAEVKSTNKETVLSRGLLIDQLPLSNQLTNLDTPIVVTQELSNAIRRRFNNRQPCLQTFGDSSSESDH